MEFLLDKIRATKNNSEFFDSMRRGQVFAWVVREGQTTKGLIDPL